MFDKIWNFFSRLNYSHPFNLYNLSRLQIEQRDNLQVLFDVRMRTISDFRSAHMNIIAGLIALLWFIWKDEIMKNPEAYKFFMYFIIGSIIYLVIWYYADVIGFRNQISIVQNNLNLNREITKKIKSFSLDKTWVEEVKEKEMTLNQAARNIINILIWLVWLWVWACFILWVYFFLVV